MGTEGYNQSPPFTQNVLAGGDLDTVFPPYKFEIGTILFLRDVGSGGAFYQRTADAVGAPMWTLLSTGDGWGKYVVSVENTPGALYVSIQDAITAAEDDGHDESSPAVVLVHPGVYAESLAMRPGIHVVALSPSLDGGVVVTGTVLVDFTIPGAGSTSLVGIHVNGNVFIEGTPETHVVLEDVHIVGTAGNTLTFTNSNVNGSLRLLGRCVVHSGDAGAEALFSTVPVLIEANNASFSGATSAGPCVRLEEGSHFFFGCDFSGLLDLRTAAGTHTFRDCTFITAGGSVATLAGAGTTLAIFDGGSIDGDTAPVFGGAGIVKSRDVTYVGTAGFSRAATITSDANYTLRQRRTLPTALSPTTFPYTAEILLVDTGGNPFSVLLPDLTTFPDDTTIVIKSRSAAGVITVTPSTNDSINLVGAGVGLAMTANQGALTLHSETATLTWHILAQI